MKPFQRQQAGSEHKWLSVHSAPGKGGEGEGEGEGEAAVPEVEELKSINSYTSN